MESNRKDSNLGKVLKICGIVLVIGLVIGLCVLLHPYIKKLEEAKWLTGAMTRLTGFFAGTGVIVNIIALTILQVLQMLLAIIPGAPVSVAMGIAFGTFWGTVLNILSTVLGTVIIVWCVEKFGMKFVNKFMNSKGFEKLTFLHTASKRNMLLFLLFLIPGTPKDLVTFMAPFTGASGKSIVIASLARIPSIILMVMVGSSLSSSQFAMTAVVLTVAAVAGLVGILLRDKLFPSKARRKLRTKNTVIFDLDGTLLNTLGDLTDATNFALTSLGYPTRTEEEVRAFVGNGIRKLMERALPQDTDEATVDKALAAFKSHYESHCTDRTAPYEGIPELLDQLEGEGYRLAIVSNKADFAVQLLRDRYFPRIALAIGERENIRRKPAPDSLNAAMDALSARPEDTIYVGDSDVDIETARNAGVACLSVTWGFRTVGFLLSKGAEITVQKPEEVAHLLMYEEGIRP